MVAKRLFVVQGKHTLLSKYLMEYCVTDHIKAACVMCMIFQSYYGIHHNESIPDNLLCSFGNWFGSQGPTLY